MLHGLLSNPLGLIGILFWGWMLYDCIQYERDRTWLYLLIFLSVIGAFVYFIARYLPRSQFQLPAFFGQWTRKEQIWQAEADARNIGKAYQYVKLGDLLYEIRQVDKAAEAYDNALVKEPENAKALWGSASIAMERQNFEIAKDYLTTLYRIDPDFLYGDMSAAYGRVLFRLEEFDLARSHFEAHIKRWSHPESHVLLARIYQQQGETETAKQTLETMISKVRSSPTYHYRKNRTYVNQGEKLLKALK